MTKGVSVPTVASLRLGATILRARKAAGLTQEQLATMLAWTQTDVTRVESGQKRIEYPKLIELMRCLEVPEAGRAEMIEHHRAYVRPNWAGHRALIPDWFREYSLHEPHAVTIRGWHQGNVPGVLQSTPYMLALFGDPRVEGMTQKIRNRTERQNLFEFTPHADRTYIIGESTFRRVHASAGRTVALDQVEHVLALDHRYPTLTIRVLTEAIPFLHLPADFTILTFGDDMKPRAYVEWANGARYKDDPGFVADQENAWQRLAAAALDADRSREFLGELRHRFRRP